MNITKGTPKTLLEAITNGLDEISDEIGPSGKEIKTAVKDFVAQHFTIMMLKNPAQEDLLKELFERITR